LQLDLLSSRAEFYFVAEAQALLLHCRHARGQIFGVEGDGTIDGLGEVTDSRHGSLKNVVCP